MYWVYVFVGGGLGSVARYGVSKLNFVGDFPYQTLISNTLSCLVLGLVLSVFKEQLNTNNILKPLLIIGFCGGFSTFSTFSFENVDLIKNGFVLYAFINVMVSIFSCFFILYYLLK
jgi:fluoride exporter